MKERQERERMQTAMIGQSPCNETCEMEILAEWEGHLIQRCKTHPWVIRKVCLLLHLDETKWELSKTQQVTKMTALKEKIQQLLTPIKDADWPNKGDLYEYGRKIALEDVLAEIDAQERCHNAPV